MEYKKIPKLIGYTYYADEAKMARDAGKILTMRLETSLRCNIHCRYCCNSSGIPADNEISYDKLIELVDEGKELGVKSIVVIGGGEPTIYPKFRDLITYINNNGIIPVIFTNTTTMTKELAHFLYDSNVSVIIKMDSVSEATQDFLAGQEGVYKLIQQGLNNLFQVGYGKGSSENLRLGASFVVSKTNYKEVVDIWHFCRKNKIFPNMEMMIPNGKANEIDDTCLSRQEWKELKLKLLDTDQNYYGYSWKPFLPMGTGCLQTLYNIYITVLGNTRPCSSIHNDEHGIILNVHDMSLKKIIESEFFQISRNIDKYLTGKCGKCTENDICVGCRGMAFTTSINNGCDSHMAICSEDTTCFK